MTLQQLEYICALDKYRHYVRAAESCGVTQATLSILVKKLEEELDTIIFDRSSHPLVPTSMGEKIISQAKVTLFNAMQIKEMTKSEKELTAGELKLSMVSTVIPIIAPRLISRVTALHPEIDMHIYEMRAESILDKLSKAELDMAIVPSGFIESDFLEIPLFREGFIAYISPNDSLYGMESISRQDIVGKKVWTIHDGIRAYEIGHDIQITDFSYAKMYEGGRISLLIDLVDLSGGMTIIPEFFLKLMSEDRLRHVRPFNSSVPQRHISMLIRKDFLHEKLLNIVLEAIREQIPQEKLEDQMNHLPLRL